MTLMDPAHLAACMPYFLREALICASHVVSAVVELHGSDHIDTYLAASPGLACAYVEAVGTVARGTWSLDNICTLLGLDPADERHAAEAFVVVVRTVLVARGVSRRQFVVPPTRTVSL